MMHIGPHHFVLKSTINDHSCCKMSCNCQESDRLKAQVTQVRCIFAQFRKTSGHRFRGCCTSQLMY